MANDELNEEESITDKAKDAYVEGKKNVKNAWVDTKAAAEKTKNDIEAQEEKL
ncbi:MAG: hypothetical protein P4L81_05630 [Candidatus Pacebacteria bacterium]|nr:hypothetical protein [Candidatus Paceibacterota bacterium]